VIYKKFFNKLIYAFIFVSLLVVGGCGSSVEVKTETPEEEIETYSNASLLVSTDELQNMVGSDNLAIIDAREGGYDTAHIPGAISMPHPVFADSSLNILSVSELELLLTEMGIAPDMKIIIYDDTTASWEAAGRIFWILEYLGCQDVHVLNGGWDKWAAEGRKTETAASALPNSDKPFTAFTRSAIVMDKNQLSNRLGNEDFVVIDSRKDEEFNGWTLYNEARGGHIKGAVQIPYEWFFNEDKTILSYEALKLMFESRGVTSDKEVTSYCTAGIRSGFIYFALRLLGYERASNYDGSIWDWAEASVIDPDKYPMEQMPHYEKLVYPAWLDQLISGQNPPTYPGNGYVILDVDFNEGYIPGAIRIGWRDLNVTQETNPATPEDGSLKPDAELREYLENLGIAHDTTVIIYSYYSELYGRVFWALMYAGVEDVRVLNGGYNAWVSYGGEVVDSSATPVPTDFGIQVPGHPEYLADTQETLDCMTSPNGDILDLRTWDEFTGAADYHSYITVTGHIPGSVFLWYKDWLDGDETLRSYTEVESMWIDAGLTRDKTICSLCTIGQRSSLLVLWGHLMGYTNVKNYDLGWYKWTEDPSNPVEKWDVDPSEAQY